MALRLYPPIVDYSMPAFDRGAKDSKVRVYFAISSFNSIKEIKEAHVTVKFQTNNANALNTSLYPAKIKVCGIGEVTASEDAVIAMTAERYYIEINASDLIGIDDNTTSVGFLPNTVYKVQIRFSAVEKPQTQEPTLAYFNAHLTDFSEWSTVCLIKGIVAPQVTIEGLIEDGIDLNRQDQRVFPSTNSEFSIHYSPGSSEDIGETLKTWRVQLYNSDKTSLLSDSGITLFNAYDYTSTDVNGAIGFTCSLPYQMKNDESYILILTIETKNGYVVNKIFSFTAIDYTVLETEATVEAAIFYEEGFARVKIQNDGTTVHSHITLRRTSSKSSFTIWEDIANKTFPNDPINWTYDDLTIEPGVYYQYGIQARDNRGRRGTLKTSEKIMGEFDDAFLVEGNRQLKLQYDFQISNASINIAESKTDTIGSKYPFIRRNGNMYYKTFQCSGLITAFMDEAELFTTDEELYDGYADSYKEYQNDFTQYVNRYDYIREQKFRELVASFLYDDKVKLFKSTQEGNMLVKLMNISFTPKAELDRMIYNFSATVVEIDEATVENLNAYGLINIGTYSTAIAFGEIKMGQLDSYDNSFYKNQNIMTLIKNKYHFNESFNGVIVNNFNLKYLRIECNSDPYLIKRLSDGTLQVVDDELHEYDKIYYKSKGSSFVVLVADFTNKQQKEKYQNQKFDYYKTYSSESAMTADIKNIPEESYVLVSPPESYINATNLADSDLLVGWLFNIGAAGGTQILIQPPNNIYELNGDNIDITPSWNITPYADFDGSVQFVVELEEAADLANIPTSISYHNIMGQVANSFRTEKGKDDIIKLILGRYYINRPDYYVHVSRVLGVQIDTEPGVVFTTRNKDDNEDHKIVIGETGNLDISLQGDTNSVEMLHFEGYQIDSRYMLPQYENCGDRSPDTDQGYSRRFKDLHKKSNKIANPVPYDYYIDKKSNQMYMYYHNAWYKTKPLSDDFTFEIQCPVEALVNYHVLTVKGTY